MNRDLDFNTNWNTPIYTDVEVHQTESAERNLIASVILLAVEDLDSRRHRQDAVAYFTGPVFKMHAELLGYDPDVYLSKLAPKLKMR